MDIDRDKKQKNLQKKYTLTVSEEISKLNVKIR